MPTFLPDNSCIVACLSSWHADHGAATSELDRRFARGESMIVAGHSLLEAYSVLTRIPRPHRVPGRFALEMLRTSFTEGVPVVALDPPAYLTLLRVCSERGIVGGSVYDAVIAACARQAGADTLLTFNARHFAPFAGPDLAVVVPAEG